MCSPSAIPTCSSAAVPTIRSSTISPARPRCCCRRVTRPTPSSVPGWRSSVPAPPRPTVSRTLREIGAVLADAGVTVVSGLAIGIDAAAHEGALDAGGVVVGVLGTGLDVVYPRRHRLLFDRVRRHGLLVSEFAYGLQPRPESFPIRNRIIAALADVVVVVEATARGGARITAERAVDYGRPVLAMPGARRNPAAAGTNALIADGAEPLLEPADVLLALGLTAGSRGHDTRVAPAGTAAAVLHACGGEAATVDQLVSRTGLAPDQVAVAVRELERTGWIERSHGACWPR